MSAVAPAWAAAPAPVVLAPAGVHVWLAFCAPDAPTRAFEQELSDDERVRARRFVFARDRHRYIVARRTLRRLLGAYLEVAPADVRFTYAAHGKPGLAEGYDRRLDFNLSHSDDAVLIAVSGAGAVGVDVEAVRIMRDRDDIARRTFAAGEFERFCALDDEGRTEAFFTCWTRKEAFVKAIGEGLSHPLERFEVTLRSDEPPRLLHIDGNRQRAASWTIAALPPLPGFATALALQGAAVISCFRWLEEPAAAVVAAANERCMA